MEIKTEKRGGRREGAGRPKGVKKPYKKVTVALPVEYVDKLKDAARSHNVSIGKFVQLAIDNLDKF